jgi:uncharacterized protein YjbI with pentapeptide repeats
MVIDPKDVGELQRALNDAASKASVLWTTFVIFQLYLAIAFGSVTHRDLFLETPIKLPLLNVDLPLVGFFVVAPIVLVIFHFYVFLQLLGLASKAKDYETLLLTEAPVATDRQYLRQRLDVFPILQFLAGPTDQRTGFRGLCLRFMAWITLFLTPVIILLQGQVTFLPYHSPWVWLQRGVLLIDVIAIWYFWLQLRPRPDDDPILRPWPAKAWMYFGVAGSACVIFFSWYLATFPGEWLDEHLPDIPFPRNWTPDWSNSDDWTTLQNILFKSAAIDEVTGRPRSTFSNRLILTDQSFISDPDKVDKVDVSRSFRGRDLRQAVLNRADLRKADFTGAILQGAQLQNAKLQKASFGCASKYQVDTSIRSGWSAAATDDFAGCTSLQDANLGWAQLQEANLQRAQLQRALLEAAQLQGANLYMAQLQGARLGTTLADLGWSPLFGAQLQGANLVLAQLQGADLFDTRLQGATLRGANLLGARLLGIQLQGASLEGAQLRGTNLYKAQLQGANLHDAHLQCADLLGAQLQGANLHGAHLQGARLEDAQLQGARLDYAGLEGTILEGADLESASIREAWAWRARGTPKLNLTIVQDVDVHTKPWSSWTNSTFVEWRDAIASIFPLGALRDLMIERLSPLDDAVEQLGTFEAVFWVSARPREELEKARAEFLVNLACSRDGAPYVARSLLENFIWEAERARDASPLPDQSRNERRLFAERLRRKYDAATCAGVKGFTEDDWTRVSELSLN